ncbi:MAG: hypothetical protein IKB15_05140 [Alistipes sp.]|nr:hypothetical protein [Alistipes sp.]
MKNIVTLISAILTTLLLSTSCVEEPTTTFEEIEQRSLKAWIDKYHPELSDNYQEVGGYYVDILNKGVMDSLPITGKDVWVWYDFTARDLDGNICETRSYELATQLGTYTDYTHYVPAFRFSGKEAHTIHEGTYLATFNKLKIGNDSMEVRYGTKMRLYLPSSVVSGNGSSTSDGGYEGQFALDENIPMIVDITIYGHVNNPVAYEGEHVNTFAEANGGLCTDHKVETPEEDAEKSAMRRRVIARAEESTEGDSEVDTRPLEFFDGRWHQPIDTLAQLYVNYAYTPEKSMKFDVLGTDTLKYPGENLYVGGSVYANEASMSDIDRRVNDALIERFGKGITYDEVLTTDSLNAKATAKVWYVGRFLDGYIFDTNIDEVKEIIYGKVESKGEALSFDMKKIEENKYILAWNYSVPTLRQGQWAAILTVSTYGYGIAGVVGSHTSTTTGGNNAYYDYLNYMNYMNYMNNYYGYGYGGMYNNGYYGYGYNPYYYGYAGSMEDTSVTVTTTSSEIPAYTPLLFQVFVE